MRTIISGEAGAWTGIRAQGIGADAMPPRGNARTAPSDLARAYRRAIKTERGNELMDRLRGLASAIAHEPVDESKEPAPELIELENLVAESFLTPHHFGDTSAWRSAIRTYRHALVMRMHEVAARVADLNQDYASAIRLVERAATFRASDEVAVLLLLDLDRYRRALARQSRTSVSSPFRWLQRFLG